MTIVKFFLGDLGLDYSNFQWCIFRIRYLIISHNNNYRARSLAYQSNITREPWRNNCYFPALCCRDLKLPKLPHVDHLCFWSNWIGFYSTEPTWAKILRWVYGHLHQEHTQYRLLNQTYSDSTQSSSCWLRRQQSSSYLKARYAPYNENTRAWIKET